MSRFLSLVLLLTLTTATPAAIITSGGYTATDEVPFAFTDLAASPGASRAFLGSDSGMQQVNIGFAFTLFGTTHTTAGLTVDGVLTFPLATGIPLTHQTLLTTTSPILPAMIAPWWDDLWMLNGILHQTLGAPGARRFVVQWTGFSFSDRIDQLSFQLVLEEGTNAIELRYLDATNAHPIISRGGSATVGIRDVNAHLTGNVLQWSFNQPVLRDGETIRIVPLPEPSSVVLLAVGGVVVWAGRRWRRCVR